MTSVVAAAGVSVTIRGTLVEAAEGVLGRLARDGVAGALMAGNARLWGPEATGLAARRGGWRSLPHTSRSLLPALDRLAGGDDDLDRVVVIGVGGAASAARAVAAYAAVGAAADPATTVGPAPALTPVADGLNAHGRSAEDLSAHGHSTHGHSADSSLAGPATAPPGESGGPPRRLIVLDTTDPHRAAAVVGGDLARTMVVLAETGDGGAETVEIDSHRRIFERAFRDAGLDDAELRRRFVVVARPGSALEALARTAGHRAVLVDPEVGDRFGALAAPGLVPAALAGADPAAELLDPAAELATALYRPFDNPALMLGAALAASASARRDKLVLARHDHRLAGFAHWAEHLIAESTGKTGKGILPVVLEGVGVPGFEPSPDARRAIVSGRADAAAAGDLAGAHDVGMLVSGPLGAQFLLWQYATAAAARVLGVNPFDRPDVQDSLDATAALIRGAGYGTAPTVVAGEPTVTDGAVEIHAPGALGKGVKDLRGMVDRLVHGVPDRGYLAVMAFLDPVGDAPAARLRGLLAAHAGAVAKNPFPVTFGWGPQVIHSTGQFHKGGPPTGTFLQLTGTATTDLAIPSRPYTLGELQLAQAYGDLRVLRARGRPVVRLHLRDRADGVAQLLAAMS